jgi:hypothetical protein
MAIFNDRRRVRMKVRPDDAVPPGTVNAWQRAA